MPGRIITNGSSSLGNAPISGVRWAEERSRAESARWTSAKLVPERQHETEAEHQADPRRADRVGHVAWARALQGVETRLADGGLPDAVLQPVPPADVHQAHDRERDQRGDDDEELQHLVVDRRREATEADVGGDDERRDDDADDDRPAEHELEHQRERVEVHARDQDRRDRERDRVEDVRGVVEPEFQVLRHRADL
jgi:hypothetical protein